VSKSGIFNFYHADIIDYIFTEHEVGLGTLFLEETAKIQFLAKLMGTPEYIPTDLYSKITTQILNEKSKKRMWDHYVAKLKWRNW